MPRYLFLLLASLVLLHTWGCYEEQEGCLDPMAVNYDVSADINADCVYPTLSFSVDHRWGEQIYSPDSFYRDAAGNPFQLLFFGLFVRELEVDTGTAWASLNSSRRDWLLVNNAIVDAPAPVGFIQARYFKNDWGELEFFGAYDSVRMQLGLGSIETADPLQLSESHPLNIRPQMYDTSEQKYYGWVLRFRTDTASGTPIRQLTSLPEEQVEWSQAADGTFIPATNASLIFSLDYAVLLRDFRADNLPFYNRTAINGQWSQALTLRDP